MRLLKTVRTPENTYIDVELYPPKINFVYVKSEFYNKIRERDPCMISIDELH